MGLREYRQKRDFARTKEPAPTAEPGRVQGVFVVQKHAARNTHYDLRLQVGDVLKSWAVPKGPSLDPREKRLAVEVEDHPLKYADFEGPIPEGQYGAGTMMVWDRGRWTPEGKAEDRIKEGELKFHLEGERLKGRWVLVRTKGHDARGREPKQPQWLLIKERDREASPGVGAETFSTSVLSGRTMDEIASGAPARAADPRPAPPSAASLPGAHAAPMPRTLKPQLAVPAERVPEGPEWLHEVKFDGYRLLIFRKGDQVRILSRRGLDWTAKLPDLSAAVAERLGVDAVIDGEAVILDTRGVSDFQALQNAIHTRRARAIVFFAFDLPWCDGYDLTSSPLEARRWLLLSLIGTRQEGRLRFSEHVEGNGPAALERIREHGLEGLVSKRMGSPYSQARTPAWVKVKCFNQQEFVIGGFTAPEGTRDEFGAMLLGYHDESGKLRFAGKVGTGFSAETLKSLGALLRQRVCPRPPFVNPPTGAEARGVTWVRPELVCQVQFRDWTAEGVIRHTSFRGLREDLDPKAVVREPAGAQAQANAVSAQPSSPPVQAHPRKAPKAAAESPAASTRRLTNPDRVVYPDRSAGYSLTKRQVYEYFEAVAPLMLPYVAGRPLAIVRCPTGEGGKSFFQKHPVRGMPPAVRGADIADSEGKIERHLMINDADGLLGLVQMSALEIHPWGSRAPPPPEAPDHPNLMIFDLDPGADVGWQTVVRSALLLRDSLTQVGLRGFARLSGGKGIHVVVPLRPLHTWAECTRFAKAAAEALVRLAPRWFIATSAIERRQGRIYIDYLRNVRGATAVASYCTRARPGAPVALPVEWDELDGLPSASAFNPMSVMRRLAAGNLDPWREFQTSAGALPRSDPA